jgi:hypothetical protein
MDREAIRLRRMAFECVALFWCLVLLAVVGLAT